MVKPRPGGRGGNNMSSDMALAAGGRDGLLAELGKEIADRDKDAKRFRLWARLFYWVWFLASAAVIVASAFKLLEREAIGAITSVATFALWWSNWRKWKDRADWNDQVKEAAGETREKTAADAASTQLSALAKAWAERRRRFAEQWEKFGKTSAKAAKPKTKKGKKGARGGAAADEEAEADAALEAEAEEAAAEDTED